MHGNTLARILMILVYDRLTCKLGHAHDAVSIVHSVLLYGINRRIHLSARTVEICSMHVYAQWLSAYHLGMNACRIGKPVVSMDYVKLL